MLFFISGITGNVGSATARQLLAEGHTLRTLARNPAKAQPFAGQGVEILPGDLTDTAALASALSGVDAAFLMVPPNVTPAQGYPESVAIIESVRSAVRQAHPPRLVVLSSVGSEQTSGLGLITATHLLEQALQNEAPAVAFVRAGSFLENYLRTLPSTVESGTLYSFYLPLDQPVPMVATADIGSQIAHLLTTPWTGHRIIELGTPATPNQIAAAIAEASGRPVQAQAVPPERWTATFQSFGMPGDSSWAYQEMLQGVNSGWIHFGIPNTQPVPATITPTQFFTTALQSRS